MNERASRIKGEIIIAAKIDSKLESLNRDGDCYNFASVEEHRNKSHRVLHVQSRERQLVV